MHHQWPDYDFRNFWDQRGCLLSGTFLATATRCMLRSLITRAAIATRRKVRRSGMISSAVLGKFWRHKRSVTSFRL